MNVDPALPDFIWSAERLVTLTNSGKPQEFVGNHGVLPIIKRVKWDQNLPAAGTA